MDTHILETALRQYAAQGPYPLHMPGHKRRKAPAPDLPYSWDMTEVSGLDDLHQAEGILAGAMARTAALWGAGRTWYLVNGSTCGILAAIRTAVLQSGKNTVLCARNCHKSVYHAIELCGLQAHWMVPPVDAAFGIYGSLSPAAAAAALTAHPDAACMVLTSPTYEGTLSNVAEIAKLCHAHGMPLIVDAAHGAHYLPLAEPFGWRGGAVAAGADLVIQSAHKTLPSLTQTALLHLRGDRIDIAQLVRQLGIFETSSPSYPLLASLDGCTGLLSAHGAEWFSAWRAQLDRFDSAVSGLGHLRVLCHGADRLAEHPAFFSHDAGKILISGADAGISGTTLAEMLRDTFHLETEMACGANVLAMTSPCDADEALARLSAALLELDRVSPAAPLPRAGLLPEPGAAVYTIAQAVCRPRAVVPIETAVGRISAEYVWAYPPGVPLIAPGEAVSADLVAACRTLEITGTTLRHTGGGPVEQLAVCT